MKKYFLLAGFFLFNLNQASAEDYLRCDFKISDNKIECPWLGSCAHKVLKKSDYILLLEIKEGQTKTGKINFRKVIIDPGSNLEKTNQIYVFSGDYRAEHLKYDKKSDLVVYNMSSGINYKVSKIGQSLDIEFKTNPHKLEINLTGESQHQDSIASENNNIEVFCSKIDKDVYNDVFLERKAIENYQYEKETLRKRKK